MKIDQTLPISLFVSGFLLLSLTLVSCTPAASTGTAATKAASPQPQKVSLGYYTGDEDSYQAVQDFAGSLNIVSADVYAVNAAGEIVGSDPFDVVQFDKEKNIATYACVSNYNDAQDVSDFDPELARAALVTHRDTLIPALVSLAAENGYDGINIDFEGIAYTSDLESVRGEYSSFIHDLASALHSKGLKLVISVPAKTGDDPSDEWSYPFDLAALGKDADYLQLMTYDEHGSWGEAGPVSGVDWVEEVIEYSSGRVDPQKLLIGLPAYGYDWVSDGSYDSFNWTDFAGLLQKNGAADHWDEESQSPWLTFTEEGKTHTVWYENTQSIRVKAALVKEFHLGGWSMWALGKEDRTFWDAISSAQ